MFDLYEMQIVGGVLSGLDIWENTFMNDFRGLIAYQKAYENAMAIFELTKTFPGEEKYSLTTQIRNSSRSVCACLAEAYRKRLYEKHFISKLSDSDMENSETMVWLDFALDCGYINERTRQGLLSKYLEVGKLINFMMKNPDKFS